MSSNGFYIRRQITEMAVLKKKKTAIRGLYPATLNSRRWDGPCNIYTINPIHSMCYDNKSNKVRIVNHAQGVLTVYNCTVYRPYHLQNSVILQFYTQSVAVFTRVHFKIVPWRSCWQRTILKYRCLSKNEYFSVHSIQYIHNKYRSI